MQPTLVSALSKQFGTPIVLKTALADNGKCSVWLVEFGGRVAVVKSLSTNSAFYHETFRRELAVYEVFQGRPPPVCTPKVLYVSQHQVAVVLEYISGRPLGIDRYPQEEAWQGVGVAQILDNLWCLRSYQGFPLGTREAVLKRYLERWDKYVARGLYVPEDCAILDALRVTPGWCPEFNHGDPIPANILIADDRAYYIDWEFAGPYVPLYDLAALWVVNVRSPSGQTAIEQRVCQSPRADRLCFAANLLNVASREIWIHRELPDDHPGKDTILQLLEPLLPRARQSVHQVLAQ